MSIGLADTFCFMHAHGCRVGLGIFGIRAIVALTVSVIATSVLHWKDSLL
jgi:hypothetical protein